MRDAGGDLERAGAPQAVGAPRRATRRRSRAENQPFVEVCNVCYKKASLAVTLASMAALSLVSMGCKGKNQFGPEDFKKITKGMTEAKVKDLLGEPTESMEGAGVKRLFWQVGDKYYSISFVEGKVAEPMGPTTKEGQDAMKELMELLKKFPEPTKTPSTKKPKEPATMKDGRPIIAVTREWLTVKGASFELGKITRTELEKLIGQADHVGKVSGNSQFLFWDKQGLRAECVTRNNKIVNFTCFLQIDPDEKDPNPLMRQPKKAFDGVFKIEGVEISRTNTRKLLEKSGRIKQPIRDSKLPGPPSFTVQLPNQQVEFIVDEASKTLTEVTVASHFVFGRD
jgi:hypothetical protein